MVEGRLAEGPVVAKGDDVRRRKVDCSEGEGGEIALTGPPDGVRLCGGTAVELTDRAMPPDVTRALGGEEGDADILRGDAGRAVEFRGDVLGEPARLWGGTWDDDVAWWRRDGGAVAMALAFARLAAIAAATLFFFVFFGVVGGKAAISSGLGQTFSTCLRARGSRVSKTAKPLSGQTSSKTQNNMRAFSLTAGFGSPNAFFKDFSNVSRPPEVSMAFFERWPCNSR
jgi:hypothetical protein